MGSATVVEANSKVNTVNTYSYANNYWTPLAIEDDNNDEDGKVAKSAKKDVIMKCIKKFYEMTRKNAMIIDSGATSTFVRSDNDLPVTGQSCKLVQMPDGRTAAATVKVKLPYSALNDKAREAHVLPSLSKHSLLSVPVLADAGYTTIFHPREKGVEVYKEDDIELQAQTEPVLQGCRNMSENR